MPLTSLPPIMVLGMALAVLPIYALADTFEDKVQLCQACHGGNGIPPDKSTPVIAGQLEGYLYLQLRDYKSGARKNDQMGPVAQVLERSDMLALAEFFSKQSWPNLRQPAAPDAVAAQALRTNASIGCTGCHLGEYQGSGTQPRLAGQSKEYLARTMLDFRSHARGNNPGMSDLMNAASVEELTPMADYLAGL